MDPGKQDSNQLELRKVLGTDKPADLMTKHLARQPLDKCMLHLSQHRARGRAQAGLGVQGGKQAEADSGGGSDALPESVEANSRRAGPAICDRVTFQDPEIISVENWKGETKAMSQ